MRNLNFFFFFFVQITKLAEFYDELAQVFFFFIFIFNSGDMNLYMYINL